MLEIELSPELEQHLENLATLIGESPGDLARKALLRYLEDLEDYMIADQAWREHDPTATVSMEEMMRELGMDDQVHGPSTKAA